jgi:hypothetical protein
MPGVRQHDWVKVASVLVAKEDSLQRYARELERHWNSK